MEYFENECKYLHTAAVNGQVKSYICLEVIKYYISTQKAKIRV